MSIKLLPIPSERTRAPRLFVVVPNTLCMLGRETFLVKVDWDDDDWPVFNGGRNITLLTEGRDSLAKSAEPGDVSVEWQADLSRANLELGWYQKSEWRSSHPITLPCQPLELTLALTDTPLKRSYSLSDRPGYLRLWGNCYDLSSPEAPAMLLRKQTSYWQAFEATMEFGSQRAGCEAGVVLWWSQFSYATIGVRIGGILSDSERPHVVSRTPKGKPGEFSVRLPRQTSWIMGREADMFLAQTTSSDISADLERTSTTAVAVRLSLACEGSQYRLSLDQGQEGGQTSVSCSAEALTITPPIGGSFTGVMFGVYSFGRGEPVLDPADFSNIRVSTRAA